MARYVSTDYERKRQVFQHLLYRDAELATAVHTIQTFLQVDLPLTTPEPRRSAVGWDVDHYQAEAPEDVQEQPDYDRPPARGRGRRSR